MSENEKKAGSGEQPDGLMRTAPGRAAPCGVGYPHHEHDDCHGVPNVPAPDVRDITDQVRYAWCWYGSATREESDRRAAQFDTWLASLAAMRPDGLVVHGRQEAVRRFWGENGASGTNEGQGIPGCRRAQRDAFVDGVLWASGRCWCSGENATEEAPDDR